MSRLQGIKLAGCAAALLLCMATFAHESAAQPDRRPRETAARTTSDNVPNALQGFSQNRDQPIHIDAATLEVQDKKQTATFTGNVHVVQGDTELRCDTLVVYYEQSAASAGNTVGAKSADTSSKDSQRIRRLEVKGNVIVTQKEQTATGDVGNFDMRTNVITLAGNVIVSQGKNVLRGDRLVVNMASGLSRMESNRGRVQGLFMPSQHQRGDQQPSRGLIPNMR